MGIARVGVGCVNVEGGGCVCMCLCVHKACTVDLGHPSDP